MTGVEQPTHAVEVEPGPQERSVARRSPSRPPALLAWLASAVTVSVIAVAQSLRGAGGGALRAAGVCLLLAAGVLIFWPLYLLARHGGGGGQALVRIRCVVRRGPYAVTRHPQYLGYTLLAWGFALLSGHWAAYLLAAASAALFYLQALQEERYCLAQFGQAYEAYRRRVPRYNIILGIVRLLREVGR